MRNNPTRGALVRSLVRVVIVAGVIAFPTLPGGAALADHNTCDHDIQNPHFSDPANGVIVKAEYWCSGNVDSVSYLVRLYWCSETDPTGLSLDRVKAICLRVGTNEGSIQTPASSPPAGHTIRTAPPEGTPAHGQDGWYIGFAYMESQDRHNGVTRRNAAGWKRNANYVNTPGSFT